MFITSTELKKNMGRYLKLALFRTKYLSKKPGKKGWEKYEDAVMIESAVRIEADFIMTRNINDYKKSPDPVILPEDFILALEKN